MIGQSVSSILESPGSRPASAMVSAVGSAPRRAGLFPLRFRLLRTLVRHQPLGHRELRAIEHLLLSLCTTPDPSGRFRRLLPEEAVDAMLTELLTDVSTAFPAQETREYQNLMDEALRLSSIQELLHSRLLERIRDVKYLLGDRFLSRGALKAAVLCLALLERVVGERGFVAELDLNETQILRLPVEPVPDGQREQRRSGRRAIRVRRSTPIPLPVTIGQEAAARPWAQAPEASFPLPSVPLALPSSLAASPAAEPAWDGLARDGLARDRLARDRLARDGRSAPRPRLTPGTRLSDLCLATAPAPVSPRTSRPATDWSAEVGEALSLTDPSEADSFGWTYPDDPPASSEPPPAPGPGSAHSLYGMPSAPAPTLAPVTPAPMGMAPVETGTQPLQPQALSLSGDTHTVSPFLSDTVREALSIPTVPDSLRASQRLRDGLSTITHLRLELQFTDPSDLPDVDPDADVQDEIPSESEISQILSTLAEELDSAIEREEEWEDSIITRSISMPEAAAAGAEATGLTASAQEAPPALESEAARDSAWADAPESLSLALESPLAPPAPAPGTGPLSLMGDDNPAWPPFDAGELGLQSRRLSTPAATAPAASSAASAPRAVSPMRPPEVPLQNRRESISELIFQLPSMTDLELSAVVAAPKAVAERAEARRFDDHELERLKGGTDSGGKPVSRPPVISIPSASVKGTERRTPSAGADKTTASSELSPLPDALQELLLSLSQPELEYVGNEPEEDHNTERHRRRKELATMAREAAQKERSRAAAGTAAGATLPVRSVVQVSAARKEAVGAPIQGIRAWAKGKQKKKSIPTAPWEAEVASTTATRNDAAAEEYTAGRSVQAGSVEAMASPLGQEITESSRLSQRWSSVRASAIQLSGALLLRAQSAGMTIGKATSKAELPTLRSLKTGKLPSKAESGMSDPATWVKGGRVGARASGPRQAADEPLMGAGLSLAGPSLGLGPSSGRTDDLFTTRERRGGPVTTTATPGMRRAGNAKGNSPRPRAETGALRENPSPTAPEAQRKTAPGSVPGWVRQTTVAFMGLTAVFASMMLLDPPVEIEAGTRYRSFKVEDGWSGLPLTAARQKSDVLLLTVAPEWLKAPPEWHVLRVAHLTRYLMGRDGIERIVILDPAGRILSDVGREALSVDLAPHK